MSKGVSKKASLELTFLAALDSVHANVDTSEIAEIQDWSRAVRGKFHGASIKEPSRLSKLKVGLRSALRRPIAADAPGYSSGAILGASGSMASHGSVQYSQMATPQLIAQCISEPSAEAWLEFIGRVHPFIATAITKAVVRRFGNASRELVDDLSQEVYLRLCSDNFRALRNFEFHHENSIYGFLKVVAANIAQDYFRSSATSNRGAAHEQKATKGDHVVLEHVFSRDASSGPEGKILLEEIDTILKTLSHEPNFARDRAIFWLYYRNGLTAKAIAGLPGVQLSVKGVESVLLRLTQWMRGALEPRRKSQPGRKTSAE
ncbi:MAG TPA: sigma-70 family RNA polymerase sigma factor [Candidatus Angelobacter sp.]|jgi:RNA polymerase sigma-70 factor (ECF subfamily)